MKYKAIIFDMDGTILDTVDDLVTSVNYAMGRCGHRHDFVRKDGFLMFGSGVHVALQRALSMEKGMNDPAQLRLIGTPGCMTAPGIDEEELGKIEEAFRPFYLEHSMDKTGPYDGIPDLLRELRSRGFKTAVVSNKPDPAVVKLAADCFDNLFDEAAGEKEQEGIRRKPAPDMVLSVLDRFGVTPREALYLGDSEVDVEASVNCGMDCVCVSWGFRPRDFLETLHPLAIIDHPQELLSLLD